MDEFDAKENGISNKKINKLLYYSHGFSLVRLEAPLVKNHFEAWIHGPVVKVVYDAFKQFEFRPIVSRAYFFDYVTEEEKLVSYADVTIAQKSLIRNVVSHFVKYSADDLEDMTHTQFGPWASVWNKPVNERGLRNRIPDGDILEFFRKRYGDRNPAH